MVNTDEFIKRLEKVLDYYGLSASSFADKINVQRSSISHLLSGRNKPSLDFILKVIEIFPEVDLYWILNGKGSFPKVKVVPPVSNESATSFKTANSNTIIPNSPDLFSNNQQNKVLTEDFNVENKESIPIETQNDTKTIERIVIFL